MHWATCTIVSTRTLLQGTWHSKWDSSVTPRYSSPRLLWCCFSDFSSSLLHCVFVSIARVRYRKRCSASVKDVKCAKANNLLPRSNEVWHKLNKQKSAMSQQILPLLADQSPPIVICEQTVDMIPFSKMFASTESRPIAMKWAGLPLWHGRALQPPDWIFQTSLNVFQQHLSNAR